MSPAHVNKDIYKKLQEILSEVTGEEPEIFTPDMNMLADLNVGPEELSQILIRINQTFGITPPLRLVQLNGFEDLADLAVFLEEEGEFI